MKMHIDISGQVTQPDKPSSLACIKDDGKSFSVYLDEDTKRRVMKTYGGVDNIIEKLHCIMIYLCINGRLHDVDELVICRDINPRRLHNILHSLFKDNPNFPKISVRGHDQPDSRAHKAALNAFRKKSRANLIITENMIEKMLK